MEYFLLIAVVFFIFNCYKAPGMYLDETNINQVYVLFINISYKQMLFTYEQQEMETT